MLSNHIDQNQITAASDWLGSSENSPEIVKRGFFSSVIGDILRAIEGRALMGAFTLSFCALDYLAQHHAEINRPTEKSEQVKFIRFLEDCEKICPEFCREPNYLWAIRCSLIHTYGKSKRSNNQNFAPRFTHNHPEMHFVKSGDADHGWELWLDLESFIVDLIFVANHFLNEWAKKPDELSAWYSKTIRTYESPRLHTSLMDIYRIPFPTQDEWLYRIQMLIPKM